MATEDTAPVETAAPGPTDAEIAAAYAMIARAAATKPVVEAMGELVQTPEFLTCFEKLSNALALYPHEFSNDLQYAVLSMKRLTVRYMPEPPPVSSTFA